MNGERFKECEGSGVRRYRKGRGGGREREKPKGPLPNKRMGPSVGRSFFSGAELARLYQRIRGPDQRA